MRGFFGRVILNEPPHASGPAGAAPTPGEGAETLQRQVLAALGAAATPAGTVDYRRLRGSPEWAEAIRAAARLRPASPEGLGTRGERLAFWINLYNALAIHGIVALGIRRRVWEVPGFFRRVSYRVGPLVLSLDEVEHGILRGNRRPPFRLLRPFRGGDPRRRLALDPVDPRVHFALSCGARSCPPVGVYRAGAVEQQLDLAARNFVNEAVALDPAGRLMCSKLFRWYRVDFEAAGGLRPFLLRYLDDGPARAALAAGAGARLRWAPYHWTLAHEPAE